MPFSSQKLHGRDPLLRRAAQPVGQILTDRLRIPQPALTDDLFDHGVIVPQSAGGSQFGLPEVSAALTPRRAEA
jgi:hypothetical protein